MFIDRVRNAFPCLNINIHIVENFDILEIKYSSKSLKYQYEYVTDLFRRIPERDKLTIELSYSDDEYIQINSNNFETNCIENVESLNSLLSDDEEIKLKILVQKEVQLAKLTVYDFSAFSSWLFGKDFLDFIKCCNVLRKDAFQNMQFECIDEDVILRSGFLNFSSGESYINTCDGQQRQIQINSSITHEICGIISDIPINFTPDDFHIIGLIRNFPKKYVEYLNWVEMFFSIAYIASQVVFEKDSIQIVLKGYRVIEEQINFQHGLYNPNFYNIFDWAYSSGNLNDKVTLARNLISLSCKWKSILAVDEAVLPAIQSNYNLYLKGNVKDYLTLKKEVSATLQNYCNKVSDAINKYTGGLKSNFAAFLGYIATVLFTKGIQKDTAEIFTKEISVLSSIVLAGSLLICFLSIVELLLKYRYFNKMIDGLKSQYGDIMEDAEINRIVDNNLMLLTAKSNFWWSLWIVSAIWIISIVALYLLLDYISGDVNLLFCINFFH